MYVCMQHELYSVCLYTNMADSNRCQDFGHVGENRELVESKIAGELLTQAKTKDTFHSPKIPFFILAWNTAP